MNIKQKVKGTVAEVKERYKEKTPKYWKLTAKISGVIAAGALATILGAPTFGVSLGVFAAYIGYVGLGCSVISAASAAVTDKDAVAHPLDFIKKLFSKRKNK